MYVARHRWAQSGKASCSAGGKTYAGEDALDICVLFSRAYDLGEESCFAAAWARVVGMLIC